MATKHKFGTAPLLTRPQVQEILGLTRNTVRKLLSVYGGPIETRYVCGRLRICKRSLQTYLDNLSERPDGN